MKSPIDIFDEIIVDNFAGGGGASTGIELAAGRPVAIANRADLADRKRVQREETRRREDRHGEDRPLHDRREGRAGY